MDRNERNTAEAGRQKQQRSELIRSISLDSIAAEVNAARLRKLREELAAATPAERRKRKRLVALYEAGELEALPTDLRASARRMKQVLFAIHLGMPRKGGAVLTKSVAWIAEKANLSEGFVRRGIRDLKEASLLIVDERRSSRTGGRGMSQYRIVLSTLRDLALTQGLQRDLTPAHSENAPSHNENAPAHSENAPSHCDIAPSHSAKAHTVLPRAGKPPTETFNPPTETFNPPTETLKAPAEPDGKNEKNGEKNGVYIHQAPTGPEEPCAVSAEDASQTAVQLLQKLGVADAIGAVDAAESHGWTAGQILALLTDLDRQSINGVPKYGAGIVHWTLENRPPGSPVDARVSETWSREDAARRQRLKADCDKRKSDAEQERQRRRAQIVKPFYETLDALDLDAKWDLARRAGWTGKLLPTRPYLAKRLAIEAGRLRPNGDPPDDDLPELAEFPELAGNPEFRETWRVWRDFNCQEKHEPLGEIAARHQLTRLADEAGEYAVDYLISAMENNRKTLFLR